MRFVPSLVPSLVLASSLAVAACNQVAPPTDTVAMKSNDLTAHENVAATSSARFTGLDGAALGSVSFADSQRGLVMTLAGSGMPRGTHAIHLHAVGNCDGPKFASAGPHWNPAGKMHGKDNPQGPHGGDLPNVTIAADGMAKDVLIVAGASMTALEDADGTALVVHAGPDDYTTDPSGNSGDRIACAVIAAPR